MIKPAILILAPLGIAPDINKLEPPVNSLEINTDFTPTGDYTLEAIQYLRSREPYKPKDVNDIMFEILIKEYEEMKNK